MNHVPTWLNGIGLGYAIPLFDGAGIVTPEALADLDVEHFEALGVSDADDRRKLFYLIQSVRKNVPKQGVTVEEQVDAVVSRTPPPPPEPVLVVDDNDDDKDDDNRCRSSRDALRNYRNSKSLSPTNRKSDNSSPAAWYRRKLSSLVQSVRKNVPKQSIEEQVDAVVSRTPPPPPPPPMVVDENDDNIDDKQSLGGDNWYGHDKNRRSKENLNINKTKCLSPRSSSDVLSSSANEDGDGETDLLAKSPRSPSRRIGYLANGREHSSSEANHPGDDSSMGFDSRSCDWDSGDSADDEASSVPDAGSTDEHAVR